MNQNNVSYLKKKSNLPDIPATALEVLPCLDWASPTIPEAKHFGINSLKGRIAFTKDHTYVIDGNTLYVHKENFIGEASKEYVLSE